MKILKTALMSLFLLVSHSAWSGPPVSVSGFSPTSGAASGGTSVVITGSGFVASGSNHIAAVKFGTSDASSFSVDSSTQLTAVTPANTPGQVPVTVELAGPSASILNGGNYTYIADQVNGACGNAANAASAFVPSTNLLCTTGTASQVTAGSSSWAWDCTGSGGGTSTSCSAPFASTYGGGNTVGAILASSNQNWQIRTAESGFVALPAPGPAGVTFTGGATKVVLDTGTPGTSATVTLHFSSLPEGATLYKYGKENQGDLSSKWYPFPATIDHNINTVTYVLTDGQRGDNDWTPNGVIDDPVGLGISSSVGIPTLQEWGKLILVGLMGWFGMVHFRRIRQR